uniref:UVR domain-containing protein n=1 Tax=Arcella intermedia TaxID=1963864 RepID=A0A6B2KXC2_9EUKA
MESTTQSLREKLSSIESTQIQLMTQKRDCHQNIIKAQQAKKKIEAEQFKLIEDAHYIEAEMLNQKLDQIAATKKKLENDILEKTREWIDMEGERCSIFAKLSQIQKEVIEDLKLLEERESKNLEEIKRTLREETQLMESSVGKAMQRIERELHHIKVDTEGLEEKSNRIESVIKERTSIQRAEKKELQDRKIKIQAEVASLLAQIETLRVQETDFNNLLQHLDKEINSARARYNSDLEKIHIEKQKLDKDKTRLLQEQEEANKEFEIAKKKLERLKTRCQKNEKLLESIEKSISQSREIIQEFDKKILESNEIKLKEENLYNEEYQEQPELKQLKNQLSSTQDKVKSLTSEILKFKVEIRNIERNLTTIQQTSLPTLEAEKALTVKRKDYKSAQTLQDEIQELQEKATSLIKSKKTLQQTLTDSTQLLAVKEKESVQIETLLKKKMCEIDIEKLERVNQRIFELRIEERRLLQNENADPQLLHSLQIRLSTERSKSHFIHLCHNLPSTPEPPLPDESELLKLKLKHTDPDPLSNPPESHTTKNSNIENEVFPKKPENIQSNVIQEIQELTGTDSLFDMIGDSESGFDFITFSEGIAEDPAVLPQEPLHVDTQDNHAQVDPITSEIESESVNDGDKPTHQVPQEEKLNDLNDSLKDTLLEENTDKVAPSTGEQVTDISGSLFDGLKDGLNDGNDGDVKNEGEGSLFDGIKDGLNEGNDGLKGELTDGLQVKEEESLFGGLMEGQDVKLEAQPDRIEESQPDRIEESQPERIEESQHERIEESQPERIEESQPDTIEEKQPERIEESQPDTQKDEGNNGQGDNKGTAKRNKEEILAMISQLEQEIEKAIESDDFDKAEELDNKAKELKNELM